MQPTITDVLMSVGFVHYCKMQPTVRDAQFVGHISELCQNGYKLIEELFMVWTHGDPRNHVSYRDPDHP